MKKGFCIIKSVNQNIILLTCALFFLISDLQHIGQAHHGIVYFRGVFTLRVAENSPAGTWIGQVLPVETEGYAGQIPTYSLGTDPASQTFAIESIDDTTATPRKYGGTVRVKNPLNYEAKNEYTITVIAQMDLIDSSSTPGNIVTTLEKGTTEATVKIIDINEPPMFPEGESTTRSVRENRSAGTNIGRPVSATDPDTNDNLTYTLGGTHAASFDIVSDTGQLQTKAALTSGSYTVTITATDNGAVLTQKGIDENTETTSCATYRESYIDRCTRFGTTQTDTITVTINVIANNAPIFSEGESTTRFVREDTPEGRNIGAPLTATDLDNDTLTYSLGGTDAASFRIVSNSGQLQTHAALDLDTKPSHTVTVSVSDGYGGTDQIAVTITVVGPLMFSSDPVSIVATVGTPITRTLPKTTDLNNDGITYSLAPRDLPGGLAFYPGARSISGTPTTATAASTYIYTARDMRSSRTATLPVTVTVRGITATNNNTYQAGVNTYCPPPAHRWLEPDQIAQDTLLFNELHNAYDDTEDWIELKNITDTPVSLKTWEISLHSCAPDRESRDADVVVFPDWTLPPGDVLLITSVDPGLSTLAGGVDISTGQGGSGAKHHYLVARDFRLPAEPYLLILRSALDKNRTSEALEDVLGTYFYGTTTEIAPLTPGTTWRRTELDRRGYLAGAWAESGYRAGIGYDRRASGRGLGTPGYPHDAVVNASAEITPAESTGYLIFSELMFASRGGAHSLPQWIEVYNPSATETVNLRGWRLEIESRASENTSQHLHTVLQFHQAVSVLPQQMVLLVTWGGRAEGLQRSDIYHLPSMYTGVLAHQNRRNTLLGHAGFSLKLSNPDGKVSDTIGNLDGAAATVDTPAWALPVCELASGGRTSLVRRVGMESEAWGDGREAASWARAVDVLPAPATTYYGRSTDISAPGTLREREEVPTREVIISEVMFTSRGGPHSLPQWIELYNPSFTQAIDLNRWKLEVEVRSAADARQAVVKFEFSEGVYVLPNQTVLLATWRGRDSGHFPSHRLYWLSSFQVLERGVGVPRNGLLSREGFSLALWDSAGVLIDAAGNLDGDKQTRDAPTWELPSGKTSAGHRASIRRLYKKGVAYTGTVAEGWVRTADTAVSVETYYGHPTDVGSPGYRRGGPLPVGLSSFRAAREETGVMIRWTTDSSLENAGFNILRREGEIGEFQVVNPVMLRGSGTTSERSVYSWRDTTAKSQGVYYYRLEEVSFSGVRQPLATGRLKGDVSTSDKSLVRWGLLKTFDHK